MTGSVVTGSAITAMEQRSIVAWPAHEEVELDGWLARFAGGYTRRSNSVNPLRSGQMPLETKLAACEAMYRQRGLPPVFKLTDAAEMGLDRLLEQRGYSVAPGRTSVQCAPIPQANHHEAGDDDIQEFWRAEDRWVAAYARMNGVAEAHVPHLRRIVTAITRPCSFLLALDGGGEAVGCGLCVVPGTEAWLFDIAVDPQHRRKGYGKRVVSELLRYASGQGASQACLQVVIDNTPARQLYESFGFVEHHQYWYRAPSG